jgi:MFS family permease
VLKDRNVMIFAFGFFNALWVVQLYTAFLPEYFRLFRGLSLGEASALAGLVPLTGIFAAAGGGVGTGLLKLRKPFLWPVALVTLFGCVGAVTMRDVDMIRLSLVLMGIGMAGVFAPSTTLLMELPGMTPRKMGAAQALTFTFGYAGAFISPFLGGTLAQFFGLRTVMLASLVFQVMVVVCLYLLPETGPGRSETAMRPTVETAADPDASRTLPPECG